MIAEEAAKVDGNSCGYSYDHTDPYDNGECRECGADLTLEDEKTPDTNDSPGSQRPEPERTEDAVVTVTITVPTEAATTLRRVLLDAGHNTSAVANNLPLRSQDPDTTRYQWHGVAVALFAAARGLPEPSPVVAPEPEPATPEDEADEFDPALMREYPFIFGWGMSIGSDESFCFWQAKEAKEDGAPSDAYTKHDMAGSHYVGDRSAAVEAETLGVAFLVRDAAGVVIRRWSRFSPGSAEQAGIWQQAAGFAANYAEGRPPWHTGSPKRSR